MIFEKNKHVNPSATEGDWWNGTALQGQSTQKGPDDVRTMVMLRNVPHRYARAMLLELLAKMGFGSALEFLYLPIDFRSGLSVGFAYVGLRHPCLVEHFWSTFQGFSDWGIPSRKVCSVRWC